MDTTFAAVSILTLEQLRCWMSGYRAGYHRGIKHQTPAAGTEPGLKLQPGCNDDSGLIRKHARHTPEQPPAPEPTVKCLFPACQNVPEPNPGDGPLAIDGARMAKYHATNLAIRYGNDLAPEHGRRQALLLAKQACTYASICEDRLHSAMGAAGEWPFALSAQPHQPAAPVRPDHLEAALGYANHAVEQLLLAQDNIQSQQADTAITFAREYLDDAIANIQHAYDRHAAVRIQTKTAADTAYSP